MSVLISAGTLLLVCCASAAIGAAGAAYWLIVRPLLKR
jgi:hypothetical protein